MTILSPTPEKTSQEIPAESLALEVYGRKIHRKLTFEELLQLAQRGVYEPADPLREFLRTLPEEYIDLTGQIRHLFEKWASKIPFLHHLFQRKYAAETTPEAASQQIHADAERLEARFNRMETFIIETCLESLGHANFLTAQRVGELGCGGGPLLRGLAQRYPDVKQWVGFDFFPGSLEFAEAKKQEGLLLYPPYKNIKFRQQNILNALSEQNFNLLFLNQVMQYFSKKEADQVIQNAHNALRPGGRLTIVDQVHNTMFKGFSPEVTDSMNQLLWIAQKVEHFDAQAGLHHNELMWQRFSEVESHTIPYPQYVIPEGQTPDAYTRAYLVKRILRGASLARLTGKNIRDFRALIVQFYDELVDPTRSIEGPQIVVTTGKK